MDGAFGLWAAASRALRHHTSGHRIGRLVGDRRSQVAERAVRFRSRLHGASGRAQGRDEHGRSLSHTIAGDEPREAMDWTPESSRRARGFAVYAALRIARQERRRGTRRPLLRAWRAASPNGCASIRGSRSSTTWSSTRSSFASTRTEPIADEATRAVVRRVQDAGVMLAGRDPLARNGRDAHLRVELVDDGGRRGQVLRVDPRGDRAGFIPRSVRSVRLSPPFPSATVTNRAALLRDRSRVF